MFDSANRGFVLGAALCCLAACDDGGSSRGTTDAGGAMMAAPVDAQSSPEGGAVLRMDAALQVADASADSRAADASADSATPGPRVDTSDRKLHELSLDPHVLDPSTKDSLATEYAQLDTRSVPLGKLVIFLPGANNTPRDWRDHGRKLAEYGFHVLIPHYNNRWSSDGTCDGKGNACGDDTRWEALTGEDSSSAVVISRADSVEGRVIAMIKALGTSQPGGDWRFYLTGKEELRYEVIIIAGISHGAASAGLYAARRPFLRNVMHSSGPAGSASAAKMTPIGAWFGFAHEKDDAYAAILTSWKNVALPGDPTNVDGKTAPYAGSHRLTTGAASSYPHGSVCVHSSSPKDASGNYLFEPVWRYLYGVP